MTANLTVPADVWACQRPGVPFVAAIVECSCSFDPMMTGRRRRTRLDCPVHGVHGLVALRDARCACDVGTDDHDPECHWCHSGRLIHDVRVEDPDGEHDGYTECRTVRCLVDLAGVVGSWPRVVGPVQLFVVDGRVWLVVDGQDARQLTPAHVDALAAACGKPPADWVGGYAAILTTTDQEAE